MDALLVVAIILILIGAAMYVTGIDIPMPRIGSAAVIIAAVGIIVLVVWVILLIARSIS